MNKESEPPFGEDSAGQKEIGLSPWLFVSWSLSWATSKG